MSTQEHVRRRTAPLGRLWLHVLPDALGVLVVSLASLLTHFVVGLIATANCAGLGDTQPPPPAAASPQGSMCGSYPSVLGQVTWDGGYLLSAILTIVLIILAWRRGPWSLRVGALALLVLMPLATGWLLALPSDDCSAKARSSHPEWQCTHGY